MSEMPLQLPASATVSPNSTALITFSQPEGNLMRNVPSLHPTPTYPSIPSRFVHLQFFDFVLRENTHAHLKGCRCSSVLTPSTFDVLSTHTMLRDLTRILFEQANGPPRETQDMHVGMTLVQSSRVARPSRATPPIQICS